MCRVARIKNENAIYHIMVRSIKEVSLFKSSHDKERYLKQMRYYQKIYRFKVYAYCIMTNHAHFIIDSNGADISRIMHNLNFKYAVSFNCIYKRRGHLFENRFKSKIIDTYKYLITLSAYIHNNPLKIKKYRNCPEKYKYSSLGVYLGINKDSTGLLDKKYIMSVFASNPQKARLKYMQFVYMCDKNKLKELEKCKCDNSDEKYLTKRENLFRNFNSDQVFEFIKEQIGVNKNMLCKNNNQDTKIAVSISVVLMRGLCNYTCFEISTILGGIGISKVFKLCKYGVNLMLKLDKYNNMFYKFVKNYKNKLILKI